MTAQPIPIYGDQDFYVPHFQVKVQGRAQGLDVVGDIISVSYKDDIKGYDTFNITINNWDADKLTFKYTNDSRFYPGKEVELWMGYYGKDRLRRVIRGKVTSWQPTYPTSGQPTLAIRGRSLLHDFQTQQESHPYENMTDSQIARQIGGRLGVTVRTDPTAAANEKPYQHLFQENQYDIVFLMRRARRIGYDLFVEEDQQGESRLYFGPSVNVRRVIYELTYGRSLIEFRPNLDTANQVGEVQVDGWDFNNKRKIEHTARRSQIATRAGTPFDEAFNNRKEVVVQTVESQEEARQLATETMERIAKEMITGSGSTIGLPDLRAGSVIHIDGLDKLFNGRYFVTSTTHTIDDGGYKTQFECRREDL